MRVAQQVPSELVPVDLPQVIPAACPRVSTWRRRVMAFLLPPLCVCTGTLVPVAVDLYQLRRMERTLAWPQLLQTCVFGLGLESLIAVALGLPLGLLFLLLTGEADLSERFVGLWRRIGSWLRQNNRRPEGGAAVFAVAAGLGGFVALSCKINLLFFVTFKNRSLAALLLACLTLLLLGTVGLLAAAFREGAVRVTRRIRRIPGLRALASLAGAVCIVTAAVAGVAVYLILQHKPIVKMIDWRPLSYPGLALGAGLVLLAGSLWLRGRRLSRGRPAGILRQAAFATWLLVFLAVWSDLFLAFGAKPTLRTTLLRRSYGAARSFDLLAYALDFDGDGYLSFFGGGDCAPFNADVHPGAPEIPGNGIDDNCFGGDLRLNDARATKRRFDLKLPPSLQGKRWNFVLITLDGLRADHLGAYGYSRDTTPTIDHLSKSSTVFERAVTQAPSTRYSVPSFLTSRYFSQIPRGGGFEIPEPIAPGALLMAEVLKKAGYRTGAALSYQVFDRSWGLDQGFDFYDNTQAAYYFGKGSPGWNKDQPYVLVDVAKKFLAGTGREQRYFLWVHFFEPHPPYVHRTVPKNFGTDLMGEYDGELRFVDDKVAQLLKAIQSRSDAERTVIVIAADHGREFGEHGAASHGYDLYAQSLHVPLVVHVPGLPPRRLKNPVAMLDLLPTFVTLAEIKESFHFEGESLVPQLAYGTETKADRAIFSEVQVGFHDSHFINAITTRDHKLIYDLTFNTYQLFDHRTDPTEKTDLSGARPLELKRMREVLHGLMERATLPNIEEEIHSNWVSAAPVCPGVTPLNFADRMEFLGFQVRPERPKAGDILVISWYLKALAPTKIDYKVIAHLRGSRGAFFDAKHVPIRGLYPTSKWTAGQIVRDQQHMRLPSEPQEWEVFIGFGAGHEFLVPKPPRPVVNTAVRVGKFSTY